MKSSFFKTEKILFLAIRIEILSIFLLACGAGYFFKMHHVAHTDYLHTNQIRYQSYLLADQLRQSSDDLTRMVRSYVSTGNQTFEQYFWDILAIRNGEKVRPENYDNTFWDRLLTGKHPRLANTGIMISLEQLMYKAGFTEEEFEHLKISKNRSDKLVSLEEVAMHAMKGEFQDSTGAFTKSGPPDAELARKIVFGDEYHKAKGDIMSPINDFSKLIAQRTEQNVKESSTLVDYYLESMIFTGILFAISALFLLLTMKRYQKLLVTKLKSANEQQKQEINRRRLSANVLANISEGVVVTDVNGNIVSVNAAVFEITGYETKEVLGKNPRIWKSQHHETSFYKNMWDSIDETRSWSGEIWNRRKNGDICPCKVNITALTDAQGQLTNYVSIFSDITCAKKSQEKLEQMAQYDQLTMLPNRHLFHDRIRQALIMAERRNHLLGILLLDLDGFKAVNDSLGHKFGDLLLKQVAKRLVSCVRQSDTVSRLGGDEFVILLPDCHDAKNVSSIAGKLLSAISAPFYIEEEEVHIGTSIGITIAPVDAMDADILLKNADTAMYYVKENGKNNFQFFTISMQDEIVERLQLTAEIRNGLEQNEFLLHYQPKMDIATGKIIGMETLVRWQHPHEGLILPGRFIPLADETGLTVELGAWIILESCVQTQKWREVGLGNLRVSINLSSRQFQDESLVQMIEDLLLKTDLDAGLLELEITETTVMQDIEQTITKLRELKSLGILLSIDNFGTGYSSMNDLKRLPCDSLKIDRSFIMDLTNNDRDKAVVKAIVSLSRHMKMKVMAEGIETEAQMAFLKNEGCYEVQGYHISRPLPADEFGDFVRNYNQV